MKIKKIHLENLNTVTLSESGSCSQGTLLLYHHEC